jgi:hypothetical protein
MESDLFTDAIGPLWSSNGTRAWSLLLAPDCIVAWPYSFGEAIKLGLRFQFGVWPADPGVPFRQLVRQGMAASTLPRTRQVRTYHVHLLRSLVIRSNSTANTIIFEKLSGETDEYAIALRQETDVYRSILADLYPDKYREKDFPATAIGRLLRK